MKKLMLSLTAMAIATITLAQQPTADATAITSNIMIDGALSENCWRDATPIAINQNYMGETPTVTADFKILWSTQGLFIGVEGFDDVWAPYWITGEPDYLSDRVELYLDFSNPQQDGLGAKDCFGNYQITANFQETEQGCAPFTSDGNGIDSIRYYFSSKFNAEGNFSMEYYMPGENLKVEDGTVIGLVEGAIIGFDVTIVDNDNNGGGRNRKVWANTGSNHDGWDNMDDVGLIRLIGEGEEITFDLNLARCSDLDDLSILESNRIVTIYPNPSDKSLRISSDKEFSQVQIINIVGKTAILKSTVTKETELDISELSAGTYIVHITMDDEVVNKTIIVK